jgi:hypothetical protein
VFFVGVRPSLANTRQRYKTRANQRQKKLEHTPNKRPEEIRDIFAHVAYSTTIKGVDSL